MVKGLGREGRWVEIGICGYGEGERGRMREGWWREGEVGWLGKVEWLRRAMAEQEEEEV